MTQPGLNSGLINLESSTLTIRPEVLWLKEEHSSTLISISHLTYVLSYCSKLAVK